jgi:hypothetical protein
MEYLTYFFEASEKKTQKAEEVKVYDVSRSTAQSSMFFSSLPRISFPTANANTLVLNATATGIELSLEALAGATYVLGKGALALGRTVLSSVRGTPQATIVVGGAIGLYQGAKFEHEHPWIGDDFNEIMLNPLVPQATKDAMWKQMQNDPLLVDQRKSLQTTKLPAMDFKVMGRVDSQGYGDIVSAYFDIDPNANKPTTLSTPIPYQPKSILFTPEDSDNYLKWSQLPGFSPHMVKTWQESFPDQSQLPDNLDMSILYKDYPDTVDKINARYPINGDLAGQKYPLYKLPEDLQVKYPDSVMIDERGFVRFEPYSIRTIKSKELIGDHDKDFQLADRIAGYETRPKEYTWHHVEDGETMVLVPKDLHKAIRHTGGAAIIRATQGGENGK